MRKSLKINFKASENQNLPAFVFHFTAEPIELSKYHYTADVVGVFNCKIFDRFP
jgi:hypothetical protein